MVFRSPQEVGGLVGEVFGRLGIPVVFESGQALDRSPALAGIGRAACNWISTIGRSANCWPCWAATTSSPPGPSGRSGRAAADVERTIRSLQIPRGRERLIEQLGANGTKPRPVVAPGGATTGRGSVNTTLAIVHRLAHALDALPQRATLPEWAKAWQRLAQETGLLRAIDDGRGKAEGGRGRTRNEDEERATVRSISMHC